MSGEKIYLRDYTPPAFLVERVELDFHLHPTKTRVKSRIEFTPNPATQDRDFFLHGEHLKLIHAEIDGAPVTPDVTDQGLTCTVPDAPFTWTTEVEINPAENTALEGLYMSNGMYCTQCEAEGFRRITYYPDRPDVMAPFHVRIHCDLPVQLSNGNPVAAGEWHDPWPKPAYLFALVAGDLHAVSGQFTTMSGRDVALNIWVRDGDQDKCDFALSALKSSMKWDEDVYGREYDLDVFNIVAVDDFNMGAMENKGLNIFNSAAVLANPATATDANFERIEAIIAHEYFHNWTGNRITCRDWFQLCLKEGLTVFRDQQFSADMRSAAVCRINDVQTLRARQFREDNGPLAHPVRPESFVEINNFYTATVYEKGAEIIGMLKTLVGDAGYARALDLYFDRHDGQACAIEDWLAVFQDATGRDLGQFKRWYSQAGTPRLAVTDCFENGTYTLTLTQSTPPTPDQNEKEPLVIPVAMGLLDDTGAEALPTQVLELNEACQTFTFDGLASRPVPSLLRGFSAPVILERDTSDADLRLLLAHDSDPFNRWEAGQKLGQKALMGTVDDAYLQALVDVMINDDLDPAFRALCLTLPTQDAIAQATFDAGQTPDPIAIYHAHERLKAALAQAAADHLPRLYQACQVMEPYAPNAAQNGKRALGNVVLGLLSRLDGGETAQTQFAQADNMTGQLAALGALLKTGQGDHALAAFYDQWQNERLVVDKWFSLQITHGVPETGVETARALTAHCDFTLKNPNRFRALMGAVAATPAVFHSAGGYDLLADQLIALDALNPQLAARMCGAFETWKRYDSTRQDQMQKAMKRIQSAPTASRDTGEMLGRLLKDRANSAA